MTTYYEVVFTDGLGNPRRWGLYRSEESALRGIQRLYARGVTSGSVRIVQKPR
jgi:hypothetical protein